MVTNNEADKKLRARFAKLREEVTASAPPFTPTSVAGAGKPATRWSWRSRWAAATLGLATMVMAVLAVSHQLRNGGSNFDVGLASVAWTGPTDFLLNTPGRELLGATPSLGVDAWLSLPISTENPVDDGLR